MRQRAHTILTGGLSLIVALSLVGCAGLSSGGSGGGSTTAQATATATATATAQATATPQPACVQLVPGAALYTGVAGVTGLTLPSGAYISSGAYSGGGAGQYNITTYTACFHGVESAIDGFSGSTVANLHAVGWALNNLFPDPNSNAYLDYCSGSHNCLDKGGDGVPFTFVGFDHYTSHTGGYTTFQLQVASIGAPSCLNNTQYYSGTPKYTLFYDGNSASPSGDAWDHFQMPPGTRVSTFNGGGTAGSTYVYYCSPGAQATVVSFLKQAMQNVGWTISGLTTSGFSASYGSNPTYQIDVSVQNPNNYYLRVFIPM